MTLSVCEFVAGVSATLSYENEGKVPLEVFFVFPMDEDSAVYSFEAMVDGKRITAELQDKTEVLGADALSPPLASPQRLLCRVSIKCSFTIMLVLNALSPCPLTDTFLKSLEGKSVSGTHGTAVNFAIPPHPLVFVSSATRPLIKHVTFGSTFLSLFSGPYQL